jgi:hypothetical protein
VTQIDVFLTLVTLAVLSVAAVQVWAFFLARRAVRHLGDTLNRLERDVRPILANVQTISADAARATSLATAQVERADRLLNDAARRVDDTMTIVQRSILGPARDGMAIVQGIRAAFGAFRDLRARSRQRPSPAQGPVPRAVPDPGDDDHASFIG